MHEQKLDVVGVADEEGLVAGGHHVAGLLVGTETNLQSEKSWPVSNPVFSSIVHAACFGLIGSSIAVVGSYVG